MTFWKTALLFSGLFVHCAAFADDTEQTQGNTLPLEPCHLENVKPQVLCGKMDVPEDYNTPNGKQISLNIAVLPAIDDSKGLTPVMFLAGGPGQAATTLAAIVRTAHSELIKTRDIILVDQRGTGKSAALECETFEDQNPYATLPSDIDFNTEVPACLAQFEQDLSQFTSENAIRDFDRVRQALGHDKINLYGGSYGTRAALVYMRLFPETLNAVVLDSVGPIEVPIGLFGQSSARAFELLLASCQQSEACQQAFPQLADDFNAVVERLDNGIIELQVPHPRLATPTTMRLDRDKLVSSLRLQLYSPVGRTMLPFVIHQAAQDNFLPMLGLMSQSEFGLGINMALHLNIVCNEDYPKITQAMLDADADNSFGRNASHGVYTQICPMWPKYNVDAAFYNPVVANIPTLILSGNLDPVTPPSNGEYAHKSLPNSTHIVVDNISHIVAGNGCSEEVISDFYTNLNPQELDASCLKEIVEPAFVTSVNGSL